MNERSLRDQNEYIAAVNVLETQAKELQRELEASGHKPKPIPLTPIIGFDGGLKIFDYIGHVDSLTLHIAELRAMKETPAPAQKAFTFSPNPYAAEHVSTTLGNALSKVEAIEASISAAHGEVPARPDMTHCGGDKVLLAKAFESHLASLQAYCAGHGVTADELVEQYGNKPTTITLERAREIQTENNPQPVAIKPEAEKETRPMTATEKCLAAKAGQPVAKRTIQYSGATLRLLQARGVSSIEELSALSATPKVGASGEKLTATERVKLAKGQ